MSIPTRTLDGVFVVSDKKQADYATVLTDATLGAGKRYPLRAPVFGQPDRKFGNDRNWAFGGNGYLTQRWETDRDISESLQMFGDSFLVGWMAAFAMGKVTTTQPNLPGNPTAYLHVIKPLDPGTDGCDMPVTTLYLELNQAAGMKRRIHSVGISDLTIDFPPCDVVNLTANFVGSGQLTTGALVGGAPAITPITKLMANDLKFEFGPQGALVDISKELVRGSLKFGFGWKLDDTNSRTYGGGLYRTRAWLDQSDFSLDFQRFVDRSSSAAFDDWVADTVYAYRITLAGPQIGAGPEKHQFVINGLAVLPEAVKMGESGNKEVWQYTIGADSHLKEGANDVVTLAVTNTQASYLTVAP
jgi:hypothetical protein